MKKFVFVLLSFLVLFSGCIFETMNAFGMFNTPKQCTQTGGKLLIKDFDFNYNTFQLSIQNTNPGEITITSFKGEPFPVTWQNNEESVLEKTETKTFYLSYPLDNYDSRKGPPNITEEITIYYTNYNGLKKSEKTTCSGPV